MSNGPNTFDIVILAAGQGKRMQSRLPKVLHRLANRPLLEHITRTLYELIPDKKPIVVYGHGGEQIQKTLGHLSVEWVLQSKQLGTGHALQQALPYLQSPQVLVLCGDVPLISGDTLKKLISTTTVDALGLVTANFPDPSGLGRIVRDEAGHVQDIVEEKDASEKQRKIKEINAGIYFFPTELIKKGLPTIENNNAQQEYYLTSILSQAIQNKYPIHTIQPNAIEEVQGVNDRIQLSHLERYLQKQLAEKFMRQGVTLSDPARFDVRGDLSVGQDVTIDINVIVEGYVKIGNECVIGPHTVLRNVILGDRVEIKAHSIIDGAEIAADAIIGPFARIRPGTVLASRTHVGNFVEIKNSNIGEGSKINHLSYVGDSKIGKQVNVGAGTITCNYDGVAKHRTIIGDHAFIGSNTQLVAPITIGEGATIGAGSTITRDAPPNQLTLCRTQQRSIPHWQRPQKKEE